MTLELASARDQAIVEDAVKNPDGVSWRVVLLIEGADYSERVEEIEWGQADIAISMVATLAGVLPRRLEGATVRLYAEVEDVLVPGMVGVKTLPEVGEDNASTELLSASAGAELATTKLGEPVSYPGRSPEFVVRDALRRIKSYERGAIRVDPLGTPIFNLVGQTSFRPEEFCLDVLSRVNHVAELYLFRDTPPGGHAATASLGLGRAEEVSRTYDWRDLAGWRRPTRKTEQYAAVEVFRELPNGEDDYRRRADVPYRGLDRPPDPDHVLMIPSTDDTPGASDRALRRARDDAEKLARGLYGGEVGLPAFDPLVQKGDLLRVDSEDRDDDGLWDRAYLLRVKTYKHPRKRSLETIVGYSATILEEDLIKPPAFVMPGLSGATLVELFTARRIGPQGTTGLQAKTGVSRAVRLDERGRWFDPKGSEGQIRVDASGTWIEVA